ncbi:hypothetical protein BDN70DRAFT_193406 [Pholiota conissans]|uniref:Uncharacterized protein n=1 Tax=Pholiota conissans TaxID=109636 RepID=A0A9P5YVT7_9AGAR|nr:hypothetical protein BDN70DRAFT_193406 [Pholiota conissans]
MSFSSFIARSQCVILVSLRSAFRVTILLTVRRLFTDPPFALHHSLSIISMRPGQPCPPPLPLQQHNQLHLLHASSGTFPTNHRIRIIHIASACIAPMLRVDATLWRGTRRRYE